MGTKLIIIDLKIEKRNGFEVKITIFVCALS
jgi:hypothetical protein